MSELSQPISRSEIIEILRVGLKAVSPYNSQPWEVQFKEGKLLIFGRYNERGFWKHQNTLYSTLGAFLENLSEGAKHLHYTMTFVLTDNPDLNITKAICEVTFQKTSDNTEYPISHIMSRYTNRKSYHQKPVPGSLLSQIRDIFEGPTSKVFDITGKRKFIESCARIERVRIINLQLRDQIFTNISYSPQEALKQRRGLDIRTLELPLFARFHMYLNRNRFYRGTIGKSFLPQFFIEHNNKEQLLQTPLLLAFQQLDMTDPDKMIRDWMNIQKILNNLHRDGLSSHLVSSSIDLARMKNFEWGSQELEIISQVEENIRQEMNIEPSSIQTLLRIGYADECKIKSLRKDPEDLFWTETT